MERNGNAHFEDTIQGKRFSEGKKKTRRVYVWIVEWIRLRGNLQQLACKYHESAKEINFQMGSF